MSMPSFSCGFVIGRWRVNVVPARVNSPSFKMDKCCHRTGTQLDEKYEIVEKLGRGGVRFPVPELFSRFHLSLSPSPLFPRSPRSLQSSRSFCSQPNNPPASGLPVGATL